jgi:cellulose synthase/poly-beta-1,6-N-acetylglucosamine synthase-like glycosyltransferase
MVYAGRRKMLLLNPDRPLPANPPSVTVLVPAKDEGERIRGCLESILAQDYPSFNLIAINDRSADNTGAVMEEIAAKNPRMKVLHIEEGSLQPGWTGKNNALFNGAKQADGQWLCFVDSDVVLQPSALTQTVAVSEAKRYDLITLLPRLESHTIWESSVVPLAAAAASAMYVIALNNNNRMKNTAFANGQYLMVRRSVYDAFGGHETVKDRYCEDVEIAVILKRMGFRPRVSWGNSVAAVRMYSSLKSIIRGWSRIYYAARVGSPWRTIAAALFVIVACLSFFAGVGLGIYHLVQGIGGGWQTWFGIALLHAAIMVYGLGTIYAWSGNRWTNALLFPITFPILLYIMFKALIMCVTKKVEWRGTSYAHQMATNLPTPTKTETTT